MPAVTPTLLVLSGILTTAAAQIMLKNASGFELRTPSWFLWMALSVLAYAVSFVLYSQILKYYALNKIYPAMTVAQIVVITACGMAMGEVLGFRQVLGLVCAGVAIYLILG